MPAITNRSTTQRILLVIAMFAIAALIAGCGSSSDENADKAPSGDTAAQTEKSDDDSMASEEDKADAIDGSEEGKSVFQNAGCGGCHTLDAAGAKGKSGPDLNNVKISATAIEGKVRSGGNGMPAFGDRLNDNEISQVAAFVAANDGS